MGIEGQAIVYLPSLREDVSEILFQITPTDTPFYNMIGDTDAIEVIHQWTKRSIRTRQVNAVGEGASFTNDSGQPATRENNTCQILRKTPSVAGTGQAVQKYAIKNTFQDEIEQAAVGLKTDCDLALVKGSRSASFDTLATDLTRMMDGLIYFLSRNNSVGTNWSRSTDVTISEQSFNDMCQTVWELGTKARDILLGMTMKRRLAGFAGYPDTGFGQVVHVNRDMEDFTLSAMIDVYRTDVIEARVHVDRNLGADSGFSNAKYIVVFDRDFFAKAWLRRPFAARRAYTADSEDGVILAELTLQGGHPNAGGWLQGQ